MELAHHAYYAEGSMTLFKAYKRELQPFWAKEFELFGIDEARELVALAGLRNTEAATFLLAAAAMTNEAQNALLKLLEEPQFGTRFVLLVPHGLLLPTVRSRMLVYPGQTVDTAQKSTDADDFLKASYKTRSEQVTKLLKDDAGAKERARDFVNALEVALVPHTKDARAREGLHDIAHVRDYVRDRSPSLKMLLEHLAVSLPRI